MERRVRGPTPIVRAAPPLEVRSLSLMPAAIGLTRPRHRLIRLLPISAGFSAGGNIGRAAALQDVLRFFCPVRIVAVDGKQNSAVLDPAFVTFRLVFRNAHADKCSG